jgi:hypothetical protein
MKLKMDKIKLPPKKDRCGSCKGYGYYYAIECGEYTEEMVKCVCGTCKGTGKEKK